MIYKKNSRLFLTVLVFALTVPGLAFLVGNQNFNFPTRAASFTDDRNQQVLTAAETAGTYSIDPLHTNVGFRVRHMGLAISPGQVHGLHRDDLLRPERHHQIFGAVFGKSGESRHGRQTARRPSAQRRFFRGGEIPGHDFSIHPNRTQKR